MLLIIDNYDSFTYNLVHYFEMLGVKVETFAHDKITISQINVLKPTHIVISPGPKSPKDAGISLEVIKHFYQTIPILGICLGHQCIAEAFGAKIIQAPEILHGRTSQVLHHQHALFKDIPNPFKATRYHSLMIQPDTLSNCFSIDAWAGETIMAISHREYALFGLQFHPEAILTEHGLSILEQFLNTCHGKKI